MSTAAMIDVNSYSLSPPSFSPSLSLYHPLSPPSLSPSLSLSAFPPSFSLPLPPYLPLSLPLSIPLFLSSPSLSQTDDSKVVSGSYDHTVKVWDLMTGQCTNTLRLVPTLFHETFCYTKKLFPDLRYKLRECVYVPSDSSETISLTSRSNML